METKTIKLPYSKYISDIEPFKAIGIPNNSIIHKTVTGCGITSFAINQLRQNCIIILPNVPVIKAKVKDHNEKHSKEHIIGVYKDTDIDDIEVYLLKDITYKKILTTPEGFIKKVLKAFGEDQQSMYDNYFLLLDECERVITDVSYRGAIAAPFDVFFNFKHKAMVSATTLPFSNELLKDFAKYKIIPDYDYSKPLQLVTTNNVLASLSSYIETLTGDTVCIFFNSTEGIYAVIDGLKIRDQSTVFCAQKSVAKLLALKFNDAYSDFDAKLMKKYNFYTSRYFSALDIDLNVKPDVIILSDLYAAEHSMIDPFTEAIQIPGRFRNGINSLTHIANFNSRIEVLSPAETLTYLHGCFYLHEEIMNLLSKNNKKASVDMLRFFKEHSPMANFYNEGKRNPFMIDNALSEHRVLGYYQQPVNLTKAYTEVSDHFKLTIAEECFPASDESLCDLKSKQSKKEQMREAARIIDSLTPKPGSFFIKLSYLEELKAGLISNFPFLPEAIGTIGLQGLEDANYVKSKITKAVKAKKRLNDDKRFASFVYESIGLSIDASTVVTVKETETLERIRNLAIHHGYNHTITSSIFKRFLKNCKRTTWKGENAWMLSSPMDFDITQE